MARELYIYWKAPGEASDQAGRVIGELQRGLCERHPGLVARLLRRPGENQGLVTWMEVYAAPPGGITPALQATIEAAVSPAMATLDAGTRHVEVFETA